MNKKILLLALGVLLFLPLASAYPTDESLFYSNYSFWDDGNRSQHGAANWSISADRTNLTIYNYTLAADDYNYSILNPYFGDVGILIEEHAEGTKDVQQRLNNHINNSQFTFAFAMNWTHEIEAADQQMVYLMDSSSDRMFGIGIQGDNYLNGFYAFDFKNTSDIDTNVNFTTLTTSYADFAISIDNATTTLNLYWYNSTNLTWSRLYTNDGMTFINGLTEVGFRLRATSMDTNSYFEIIRVWNGTINDYPIAFETKLASQRYPSNVLETQLGIFEANLTFSLGENPVVQLEYNGTQYSATQTSFNNINAGYTVRLDIPLITAEDSALVSWHWNITDSGTTFNSSQLNHTVFRISLSNCSTFGAFNNFTVNYSIYDELTAAKVKVDLTGQFDFWATNGTGVLYRNYTRATVTSTNTSFCLSPNVGNLTGNISLFYEASGYDPRESYFSIYNLDNISANVSLYLLASDNSTTFEVTVRDTDYINYAGVTLVTLKYDIDTDSFIEVERSNTDEDGKVLTHLVLEEVYYSFMVLEGATILHTTQRTKAYCPQSAISARCLLEVVIPTTQDAYPYLWDEVTGLSYSLNWNNVTNITALTYSFDSDYVDYIRFLVYQFNNTICDTNQTIVSGIINCDLTGETGIINREVRIFREGFEITVWEDYLDLRRPWDVFGTSGLFLTIIFLIAIATAGLVTGNPMATMIIFFVGLGVMTVTGIGGLSIGAFVLLAVIAALVILKLRQ